MTAYEPVIGLEIHVQLSTRTKMFCGCALSFGAEPNTHTCPVCLGLPGSLPVVNAAAIEYGLMIGMALECELAPRSIFHRKNYFYPDNAKGYQISQFDEPLCRGGRLADVRINRVHLEEDAAKLVHAGASGRIHGSASSVVDFNRGGTPLVEIVTEPDVHSPEQAREWLNLLRSTLRQLGVSDVDMSQGSLRADANVSIRPFGTSALGTKTELKNMNSFRFLEQGVRAEIARQTGLLEAGEAVELETLHFDPVSGALTSLRSKEEAHDYRYFPEPDLVPIAITAEMLERARAALPPLPEALAERFTSELGLNADSARQLASRGDLADFFERALAVTHAGNGNGGERPATAQTLANWVIGELAPRLADRDEEFADSRVTPAALASLALMVDAREINPGSGREVLEQLIVGGGDPASVVAAQGLAVLGATDELTPIVDAAIGANADAADRVRGGKLGAIGPIVGHVMRETGGRADAAAVQRLVRERLGV
jgi:aspartyl-tRNA(Asn)/glutamyl-tRNA(Gln) amidotransferase subunit B